MPFAWIMSHLPGFAQIPEVPLSWARGSSTEPRPRVRAPSVRPGTCGDSRHPSVPRGAQRALWPWRQRRTGRGCPDGSCGAGRVRGEEAPCKARAGLQPPAGTLPPRPALQAPLNSPRVSGVLLAGTWVQTEPCGAHAVCALSKAPSACRVRVRGSPPSHTHEPRCVTGMDAVTEHSVLVTGPWGNPCASPGDSFPPPQGQAGSASWPSLKQSSFQRHS